MRAEPNAPDGFEVPVHRSLTEPILVGGLPRTVAYVVWTVAAMLVLAMRQWWTLVVALAVHATLAALTKRDPYFVRIFIRALLSPSRLDP